MARSITILFLILAIVFMYGPLERGEVSQVWKEARPGVILLMDSLYVTIRDFVAGSGAQDGIDDDAPGLNFEIIVTRASGVLF